MLQLNKVSKKYGSKVAVSDLDLSVENGKIFGFLGPNGAGKTTTLNMIVGLLEPDSGTINIEGIDVQKNPLESKKKFSFVPDNPDIYEKLTGIQYLDFLSNIYGLSSEEKKKRIRYYGESFEMIEELGSLISSYSHGMRQKIVLIGALIHEPEVFILDEPMVGLDPKSSFRLKEIMRERCDQGKIVFFSTHVMEVAEKLCDEIAIINKGKIIACGTLEKIKEQSHADGSLEKIFLELTE